jgi:hypothetical protein
MRAELSETLLIAALVLGASGRAAIELGAATGKRFVRIVILLR